MEIELKRTLSALVFAAAGIAEAQTPVEYPIPIGNPPAVPVPRPQCIVAAPDGNLWYANRNGNRIGKITPAGAITEYSAVGTLGSLPLRPQCVTLGTDGNVWFTVTETTQGQIGKITPAGVVTIFPTLVPTSRLYSIAPGEDGAVWFTESGFHLAQIGRAASDGTITHFPIATPANDRFGIESSITPGPDHALWFTEIDANKIGRITTAGAVVEYDIPTPASSPMGIVTGPDGALWFAESTANKIGRVTTSGVFTEFLIPTAGAAPKDITAGPDGALWFTEPGANAIGRVTAAGVFSEIPVPTASSGVEGITSGPGGIWFTEFFAGKIGFLHAGPGTNCVPDATHLCLNGGRFQLTVTWSVPPQGTSGVGTAIPVAPDTGVFWFFSSNNLELMVKVLDGRAFNGRWWVFYGALSNVEYTITVTDTATGAVQAYFNPYGTLSSLADTAAFSTFSPLAQEARSSQHESRAASTDFDPADLVKAELSSPPATSHGSAQATCIPDALSLCLTAARFKVQVAWRVPLQGTSGVGTAAALTSDTGTFWFFSSNNLELIIKILDARVINGKFWVFYGALSNVEYTITVTDTQTGAVKTYFNPSGTLASVADTSAF